MLGMTASPNHPSAEGWIQALVARFSADSVVTMMYSTAAKIVRKKKYEFLGIAIDRIAPDVVVNSWHVCGLLEAPFDIKAPAKYVSHYNLLLTEDHPEMLHFDDGVELDEDVPDAPIDETEVNEILLMGSAGVPYPKEPPQRVENELIVRDPLIRVDHVLWTEKKNPGRPAKKQVEPSSHEKLKQRFIDARRERRSAAKIRANFHIRERLVVLDID